MDIVIANWYDNVTAVLRDKDSDFRGIQVYNKELNSKGDPDYPFLSIKRINDRSSKTNGRLKKMIRFLKNIKVICICTIVENRKKQYFPLQYNDKLTNYSSKWILF